MKKLSFFIMLLCAVTCYGEIVSEVSFNPSRMGDYNYLKVADKATLVGGLETDYLNIRSNGTVTLKNSASSSATFKVDKRIIGEDDTEISFPNAAFEVDSAVYAVGGKGEFVSGEIEEILGGKKEGNVIIKKLKQKAGTLTGGSVTIEGGSGDLYDGESINGFWLEGNLIPTPTSLKNKNCEMEWDERTTSSGQKVKVLAMTGCSMGTPSTPSTPSTGGESKFSCGTVYVKSTKTYNYTSMDYQYSECAKLCSPGKRCPSQVVVGAKMNSSYGGLDCVQSCSCVFNGYGTLNTGFVTILGLKSTGETCTADEVVWL